MPTLCTVIEYQVMKVLCQHIQIHLVEFTLQLKNPPHREELWKRPVTLHWVSTCIIHTLRSACTLAIHVVY